MPEQPIKILAIANQKGGVGKTTFCCELAVAASRAGLAVAVLDCDPQATAAGWAEHRAEAGLETIATQALPAPLLEPRLKALAEVGCQLVIIDTPPAFSETAGTAIGLCDLTLIPVKPAPHDLTSVGRTIAQCQAAKVPFSLVLNMVPGFRGRELTDSIAALEARRIPLAPVIIHAFPVAVPRAQTGAMTTPEHEPDGKAAAAFAALWAYVADRLELPLARQHNAEAA